MKKGLVLSSILATWLFAIPSYAEPIDSMQWFKDDYVAVGAVDVPKLAQRRIYTYLMDFFVTDQNVKQAFTIIRASGIVFEEVLQRIVVGIPADVDKSEHIILWETSEDLTKYKEIFATYEKTLDKKTHQGIEFYATKRENECMAILGNVLVLGSELKVKSILDAHKANYTAGVSNPDLQAMVKRADKKSDAWLAFALDATQRQRIGRDDPIIDMTSTNEGALKLGDIQAGLLALDFSKGLKASSLFVMPSEIEAQNTQKAVSTVLSNAQKDGDIQALGVDTFIPGIRFKAQKNEVLMTVSYDQETFDKLIALVTQVVKSIPGQPQNSAPSTTSTHPNEPSTAESMRPNPTNDSVAPMPKPEKSTRPKYAQPRTDTKENAVAK